MAHRFRQSPGRHVFRQADAAEAVAVVVDAEAATAVEIAAEAVVAADVAVTKKY